MITDPPAFGRRHLFQRGSALAFAAALPGRSSIPADVPGAGLHLTAAAGQARLAGEEGEEHSATVRLPSNPLAKPDLATAERHEIALQGGMMSGMGMMGMRGAPWAINGTSMTGDGEADMPPLLTLTRGRSYVLALRNETAWWHPMHLHGHSFQVLTRNGAAVGGAIRGDTVLLAPHEAVDVAFVADNPGNWMLHCHVTDHQVAGLMTVIRVA